MATYKDIAEVATYDPENGTFERIKSYAKTQTLGPVDISYRRKMTVKGKIVYLNQIAYALVKGKLPLYKLTHKDGDKSNYKWSNIVRMNQNPRPEQTKGTYVEIINGISLEIDSSRSSQPNSTSSKMRQSSMCNNCTKQPICLDDMFIGDCLGRTRKVKSWEKS